MAKQECTVRVVIEDHDENTRSVSLVFKDGSKVVLTGCDGPDHRANITWQYADGSVQNDINFPERPQQWEELPLYFIGAISCNIEDSEVGE